MTKTKTLISACSTPAGLYAIAILGLIIFIALAAICPKTVYSAERGKCVTAKASKKAPKKPSLPATIPGEITLSPDASMSIDSRGRVEAHPEMAPVRVDLSGVPEDTSTARKGNPVAYRNTRHEPFVLAVAAGRNADDQSKD